MIRHISFSLSSKLVASSVKKRIGRTISPSCFQIKKSYVKPFPFRTIGTIPKPLSLKIFCNYSTNNTKRINEEFAFLPKKKTKAKRQSFFERTFSSINPVIALILFFVLLVISAIGLYLFYTMEPRERLLRFIAETIYRGVLDSPEALNIAEIEEFKPTYSLRVLQRDSSDQKMFLGTRITLYLLKMRAYLNQKPISLLEDIGKEYATQQPIMAMTVMIPLKTGGTLKLTYDLYYGEDVYRVGDGVHGRVSPYEHRVIELYRKIKDSSYNMEPLPKEAPKPYMTVFYRDTYESDRDNIEVNKMVEERI